MRLNPAFGVIAVLMSASIAYAEGGIAYGVDQSSSTWQTNLTNDHRVPGIDEASVLFLTLKSGNPKGVTLVLWSDSNRGFRGRGEGSAKGASYRGEQQPNDRDTIEIEAETTDGETGTVRIADRQFHLDNGPLFLISTRGDRPEIVQLPLERSKFAKVRGGHEKLVELAKENEKIAEFWNRTAD